MKKLSIILSLLLGAIYFGYGGSYENVTLYSAEAFSLQGANACSAGDIDALYLNPANIGRAKDFAIQATVKSPYLGYFPSLNSSAGMILPVIPSVLGFGFCVDYFMDDTGYLEYAARIGAGWNLDFLMKGLLTGITVNVFNANVRYSEFGTNFSYETNYPFLVTAGFSVSYTFSERIRGSVYFNNIQFFNLFTNVPAILSTNTALPPSVTVSQSIRLAQDHDLMLAVAYYLSTYGDRYEITGAYHWSILPYILDINTSVRLVNIVSSQIVGAGINYYLLKNVQLNAGLLIYLNAPNPLGDIYVSTVIRI